MKKLGFSLFREGNEVKNRPTLPLCLFGRFSVVTALFASLFAVQVRAEWKTETYDLVTGWNAIYLHIDPSYDTIENLVNGKPIDQVWLWTPDLSSAQFITSVEDPITAGGDNWLAWVKNDANNSNLEKFIGNAAYLIHATENVELSLKGKVVPPVYTWTATGQNFLGFSTSSGTEPTFSNFFGLAEDLDTSFTDVYRYPGGETGVSPVPSEYVAENDFVKRGEAFWVSDSDYNRFFGTFSITLQDLDGVHLGTSTSAYRIRLTNTANESLRVTLEMVMSDSPAVGSSYIDEPPLLIRGSLDPTTFTYSFAALSDGAVFWDLNPAGEVGSSVEVVFGVDRLAMTTDQNNQATQPEDLFGGILRFTDNLNYTLIDVPTTAEVGSLAGLWVGEAKITQVQQALSEYEVDEDGETALNDDGSAVVSETDLSFGDVAQSFPLRLIMHRDESGTTRLLQRVYYGLDVPEDQNDAPEPILATGQGLLNEDYLDTARRITAVHLPWSIDNNVWTFDNSLDFVSTMSTTVSTLFDDQGANPFVHTYHPDHDNRSPLFEAYGDDERGFESYDIIREIALNAGTTLVTSESTTTSTSAESNSTTEAVEVPSLPAGIKMLGVPQGGFVMGNDDAVGPLAAAHSPERVVYMSPFEMSEAEITVQQYVDFLNAASADGMIEIREDADGTFVVGATGQPYAGLKFVELSGSRVLKDHDGDGDIDPENPLNQCWIEADEDGFFSVKDPGTIDWANFEYFPIPELNSLSTVENEGDDGVGGSYALDQPIHVIVDNDVAYVSSLTSDSITILDVSDPSAPIKLSQLIDNTGSSASDQLGNPYHMTLEGDLLFVSAAEGTDKNVMIYDVSDPSNPIQRARLRDNVIASRLQKPRCTAVLNNTLYVAADEDHALVIFDITDVASGVGTGLSGGAVLLNQIVDGETQNGFTFSQLRGARWVSVAETDGKVYAYVLAGLDNALTIIDVTIPSSPELVAEIVDGAGEFDQIAGGRSLILDGSVAYLSAEGDSALTILDISNPASPVVLAELVDGVGLYQALGGIKWPALSDNLLFIPARDDNALTVVDVSDPSRPELLTVLEDDSVGGSYSELSGAFSVAVDGGLFFVSALDDNAVSIFEMAGETIADWPELQSSVLGPFDRLEAPLNLAEIEPVEVVDGSLDSASAEYLIDSPWFVLVQDDVAFVAAAGTSGVAGSASLTLLDVSDPSDPRLIRSISDDTGDLKLDNNHHMRIDGDYLFVAATRNGGDEAVTIFRISALLSGESVANSIVATIENNVALNDGELAPVLDRPQCTAVADGMLYVVGFEDKLSVFDVSTPELPSLVGQFDLTSGGVTYGDFKWIEIAGDIAFVSGADPEGVLMVDLTNRNEWGDSVQPTVLHVMIDGIDGFDHIKDVRSILLNGETMFLSSYDDAAVTIVDVSEFYDGSDSPTPQLLSVLLEADGYKLQQAWRLSYHDGLLIIPALASDALNFVDVSDPEIPILVDQIQLNDGEFDKIDSPSYVAIDDSHLFVAAVNSDAVTIIDYPHGVVTHEIPSEAEVSTWPAAFIKWHGAKSFAEYYGCDLPTEAQWEYAAKGGADYDFATGDGLVDATRANYNEYNFHPDTGHVEPVKTYAPNPFGFYDMSGNVWEWCRDWYDPDFYSSRPNPDYDPYNSDLVVDSVEPTENGGFVGGPGQDYTGDARVKRGGSWNFHETSLHTAERERDYTWRGNDHFGFRVVRESYSIEPIIAADFDALTSSATSLSGTYQERITLIGKDDQSREYNVAGEFKLIRISEIDTLTTAE